MTRTPLTTLLLGVALAAAGGCAAGPLHDVVIRNAVVYDGSGSPGFQGELAIDADRIAFVGARGAGRGRTELDARGKAVAPGFINMLAHPEESLIADGRALSDLRQGVTLELLGEDSMGPLSDEMRALLATRQGDIRYPVDWHTLGEYLSMLERRGIATLGAMPRRSSIDRYSPSVCQSTG